MSLNLDLVLKNEDMEDSPTVVKLSTSYWKNRKGIHIKRSLNFMRRLSKGYNVLEEDFNSIGGTIVDQIINLNECVDGLYEVILCNEQKDWETGHIEDYDYKLISYMKS
jgi:hypothetical protein